MRLSAVGQLRAEQYSLWGGVRLSVLFRGPESILAYLGSEWFYTMISRDKQIGETMRFSLSLFGFRCHTKSRVVDWL